MSRTPEEEWARRARTSRVAAQDEDEARELHASDMEMGSGEDDAPGRVTVLQESGAVHQGRLGAAIKTLRMVTSSVRRSFGRFAALEWRADTVEDRVTQLEWLAVGATLVVGTVLWSAGAAVVSAWAVWLYLWWSR